MRISSNSAVRTLGWPAWSASLLLFAGVCAIVAYWGAVLLAPRAPIAPTTITADPRALPELQQSAQLFGLSEPVAAVAQLANVQVVGIVAAGRLGSAILAVDGKPPRPYAVGEELTASQRLAAVEADRVVIASSGRMVELSAPGTASLDVLTSGAGQPSRAAPGRQAAVPSVSGAPTGAGLPPPPGGLPSVQGQQPAPGVVPVSPDQENAPGQAAPAILQKQGD